ncbi:hypothetical protein TSAR_014705 [Trichomalopsis sarcophagae]|uniref:G/T mismatch-specific thymine DNA glycosylase n=1 Tax=Trichomalopsis sarcophagae TaxID=543379 RepID=A0A232EUE8_9HYME|nr:hypothetical protein TSAR_014705 [Trichomalopsis sarcophagae]
MKVLVKKFNIVMSISLQKLKKRTPPQTAEKPAKKSSRFDGLSEEEVKKNTLKDILEPDLDLVFVGINPSLMAAHTGRYYAGPGNHFYKLLYESKLIPEPVNYEEDDKLLQYNIGLTNIVARATRSSADLSKSEIRKGAMFVQEKLKQFKPKIAIFNGKCIYEEFSENYDKSTFKFGLQPHRVGDTTLWVVPSSSARCANFPRMQDKLHFYTSLKKYLSFLKGEIKEVNPEEFRFQGKCKQAIPSTSKMWRRKGLSAFAHGGRIVNKETICMDTSEENILAIPRSSEFIIKNVKNESDDSQKDSGVSTLPSDDSQQLSQDNEVKENDPKPKRRQLSKRVIERKVQTRAAATAQRKEYSEPIDFVSLIKQRLSNKEQETSEDATKDCDNEDESLSHDSAGTKKLKFSNLRSTRSKKGFKVKEVLKIVDDI